MSPGRKALLAEDDDDSMFTDEHVQIATHEHHRRDDSDAGQQPDARHNIHGRLQRVREPPAVLDGDATHSEPRESNPTSRAIKDALPNLVGITIG